MTKYKYSLIVGLAIVILSLIPIPEVKPLEDVPFVDKWTHLVMYGALAFAMWVDGMKKTRNLWFFVFLTIALPAMLGGILEVVQPFVHRSCEILDFIADSVGALLGTIAGLIVARVCKVHA